jgi:hypothetical protein
MVYITGARKIAGTAHMMATPSWRWVAAAWASAACRAGTGAAPDMPVIDHGIRSGRDVHRSVRRYHRPQMNVMITQPRDRGPAVRVDDLIARTTAEPPAARTA